MDTWLKPVYAALIENKKFSDCRILVGNESFDCHKVILASSSEFFERLFLGSFRESESSEIRLEEVKPEIFALFIQYAYTYSIEKLNKCNNSMLMELMTCGNRWLVKSLVSECVKILKDRANTMLLSDVIELFQTAYNTRCQKLEHISVKVMKSKYPLFLNCNDVLTMTPNVFEHYTIFTKDVLPEIDRFKMIEAYVTTNGLIDSEPDRTSEVKVHPKKEGDSDIDDELVEANTSTDVNEQKSSENEGELCEKSDDAVEPKNTKIKKLHSKYVQKLLGYIQYNKMQTIDYYNIVGKSPLLSLQEKFEIMFLTFKIQDNNTLLTKS